MPLPVGTKLGPYEILDLIGEGGMGEVYRARDTRLNRDVAVKVSKDQFSERFGREARSVAALNHPNICHLYDVGPNYLVMEFVEGESLSALIKAGPLPLDTCLNYARQIVEGIEAAHDKGIVHRDLKPANIKITPEGTVKILDFGLAKALEGDVPSAPTSDSPTLSMAMTRAGMILGTAAYMSPEQAKGKPADRRADIWAFGVVLFEMLEGKQTFAGDTAAETLASVLKEPVVFERLPKETPAAARRLIERCLDRDVRMRLQAIGEARIILDGRLELWQGPPQIIEVPHARRRAWIPWTVAGLSLLALAVAVGWIFRPSPPLSITRFPYSLGEGVAFTNRGRPDLAISPDGTQMVYVANRQLYLRSMAELEGRPIPGTDLGTGGVINPAFSPDGKSVVFSAQADKTLKRIAISGGSAVTICPYTTNPTGVSWSEQGIVFADPGEGILLVSPNGGKPAVLIPNKAGDQMEAPQMLPGGEAVLFTIGTGNGNRLDWDKARIVVQTLKSGAQKVVLEGGADARYLPTGHLVYALGGVLFAVAFDLKHLQTSGGPVGIVEGVARGGGTSAAQFAFSSTGTLIYIPGPKAAAAVGESVLGFADRMGELEALKVPSASYRAPRVSRDGKQVAYQLDDGKEASVWIWELSGATAPRRLTLPGSGANSDPIWSPDSQRVAFHSDREGDDAIWWQRADGNGVAERLTKPDKGAVHSPDSWSPDGQTISFTEVKERAVAVWTYSLRDKKATVFAATPGTAMSHSAFSPDGRWMAYQANVTSAAGRIYVRPFPATTTVYAAPVDLNPHHPMWSPDGKELFYAGGQQVFGSMLVKTQPSVTFGSPVRVPRGFQTAAPTAARPYDVFPDGKRFLRVMPAQVAQASSTGPEQIQVVLNWFEDVRQRAPGK